VSTSLGLFLLVFTLLLLRQNVMVMLGCATAYAYLVLGDGQLRFIVLDAWEAANKEVLLSIPLYLLAGNIMSQGSMAARLIRLMRALAAPVPGGLAVAAIISCGVFAAVSGSGTVTLLAIGSVMYPALVQAGYSRSFAIGALCAGATLGVIIPPSIPLILYGVMTQTSITDLFRAGIGPGLLLMGLMTAYALIRHRNIRAGRWDGGEIILSLRHGIWSLLMPVLILGGIYSGYFTATESAAVAVVYALVIETLVHRNMGLRDLYRVTGDTTRLLGSLFPVLMMALSLNVFLTYEQVPEALVGWLTARLDSPVLFLLIVNLMLLAVGCVMDIGSAILILAPILHPVATGQGVDPVHFGIVMVMNLEIGYLTPPLGLNLIIAMSAFREDFWTVCRAVLPFLALMLLALLLVTFLPGLSLVLAGR